MAGLPSSAARHLPAVLACLAVAAAVGFAVWRFAPVAHEDIVMVDVARIVSAERAALNQDPVEGRLVVARTGKTAEQTIRRIAGPKTIVLVKQAVVADAGRIPDITDAVLHELSLPTDVRDTYKLPPLTPHAYTEQGQAILKRDEERAADLHNKAEAVRAKAAQREAQAKDGEDPMP